MKLCVYIYMIRACSFSLCMLLFGVRGTLYREKWDNGLKLIPQCINFFVDDCKFWESAGYVTSEYWASRKLTVCCDCDSLKPIPHLQTNFTYKCSRTFYSYTQNTHMPEYREKYKMKAFPAMPLTFGGAKKCVHDMY